MAEALVDSSFLIAISMGDDANHSRAIEALKDLEGRRQGLICTEVIFSETLSAIHKLSRSHSFTVETAARIKAALSFLDLKSGVIESAFSLYSSRENGNLSYVDCHILAVMRGHGIDELLSFDKQLLKAVK